MAASRSLTPSPPALSCAVLHCPVLFYCVPYCHVLSCTVLYEYADLKLNSEQLPLFNHIYHYLILHQEYADLKFKLVQDALLFGAAGSVVTTATQGVDEGLTFAVGVLVGVGYVAMGARYAPATRLLRACYCYTTAAITATDTIS